VRRARAITDSCGWTSPGNPPAPKQRFQKSVGPCAGYPEPRPGLADAGIGRADHHDLRDVRPQNPLDLPPRPVTSSATRSVGARLCANSSSAFGVVAIRPAERRSPSSTTTTSQKSRCTSKPIALPTEPNSPSSTRRTTGEPAGERQRPIRAHSTTRASRRGGHRNTRARSSSSKPACATAFSAKALSRPSALRPGPDSNSQSAVSGPERERRVGSSRTATARHPLAWNAIAGARPLLCTDAEAWWAPMARPRTPGPRRG
jgi:hypothetical protein